MSSLTQKWENIGEQDDTDSDYDSGDEEYIGHTFDDFCPICEDEENKCYTEDEE